MADAKALMSAVFQSTLPARGATAFPSILHSDGRFQSTLPARGATRSAGFPAPVRGHFNPRSPHGERPRKAHGIAYRVTFQSTLPARGATGSPPAQPHQDGQFQSTLPARGATDICQAASHPLLEFQSTLPARGATLLIVAIPSGHFLFQSTLPARGATTALASHPSPIWHFNPRSPHGERQRKVTILSIRIIGFAQKVYHKTVLLRISLAENAVILPKRPQNPVRTSLQKAGGLRFARAIRAARPYSISSPSGA